MDSKQHELIDCVNGCCSLVQWPVTYNYDYPDCKHETYTKKAGVIVSKDDHILIIKSRGLLWGFPKGTANQKETTMNCAKRELQEETGMRLNPKIKPKFVFKSHDTIYYGVTSKARIDFNDVKSIKDNDSTGIGWININCLKQMIKDNIIKCNSHLKWYLLSLKAC